MSESISFQSGIDKSVPGLKALNQNHLKFSLERDAQTASKRDWWLAAWVSNHYKPGTYYDADEELRACVDWVGSNYFTPDEPGCLNMLRDSLVHHDPFLCLADFRAYSDAHLKVDAAFKDRAAWARMAILNTARMGKFSSDRTIEQYSTEIWKLDPVRV